MNNIKKKEFELERDLFNLKSGRLLAKLEKMNLSSAIEIAMEDELMEIRIAYRGALSRLFDTGFFQSEIFIEVFTSEYEINEYKEIQLAVLMYETMK